MNIIESRQELAQLASYITTEHLVVDVVYADADNHPCNNKPSLVFVYSTVSKTFWCVPIFHHDALPSGITLDEVKQMLDLSVYKKFVFDKKSMVQAFGSDSDFIDISILRFSVDGTVDEREYTTNAHQFMLRNFGGLSYTQVCVPLYKHAKRFEERVAAANVDILLRLELDDGFKFVNSVMVEAFAKLEQNGLQVSSDFCDVFGFQQKKHVRNNRVFTQYNLLTSTGRPSNRFAGVNYAAIPKEGDERGCFVSRYGESGMLVMMDYSAFHPRLIAHLVNFPMSKDENPYAYLARYYFNKKEIDEEDIAVSKGFTFTQIYGGFSERWLHIPYFEKVQQYINHRWDFFNNNGYIETPRYRRKIKPCHIDSPNPSKLFNYILQAFETEMAVDILRELLAYLENKKTKPVLYTYDSVLFDAHKDDGMETIKRIKEIMEGDKFPVKISVGRNYKDMRNVEVS